MEDSTKKKNPTKKKREVQVVSCPSAFPISTVQSSSKKRQRESQQQNKKPPPSSRTNRNKKNADLSLLDWHDTAKEIRNYGATAFVGKQKRDYEDEQYHQLTGRHKKKHKVPLPIVRGIKKAAAKRDARAREEAKAAGIVLPTSQTKSKKQDATKSYDSTYRSYGPAPSVGFMKNGILRVDNKNKKRR